MREFADGAWLLAPEDYRRMRWKNGRGWTTEIAVHPVTAGFDGQRFEWRVSLAEIENDGEFSAFPGYDRTILLAEGRGMELSFDCAPPQRIEVPYKPFSFKGEWHTDCRLLDGLVRDFNVMSARTGWRHRCEILHGTSFAYSFVPETQALIAYCFRGSATAAIPGHHAAHFKSGETLHLAARDASRNREIAIVGPEAVVAVVILGRQPGVAAAG
jgi:environmental stress-induced protein Ves